MKDKPATLRDRIGGFAAGIASGATKLAVGHPFDTVKVRMQTQGAHGRFKGPMDCLKKTIQKVNPSHAFFNRPLSLIPPHRKDTGRFTKVG
jgi:hypothetical protein